jgi:hypothetical protein
MKTRSILFGLLMITAVTPAGAGDRLVMRVSPTLSFAPANLVVRTTIERDAANRAIEIVAESDRYYRASEVELNGLMAPRTATFEFHSLPSGTYEVKARLLDGERRSLAVARQEINVMMSGGK